MKPNLLDSAVVAVLRCCMSRNTKGAAVRAGGVRCGSEAPAVVERRRAITDTIVGWSPDPQHQPASMHLAAELFVGGEGLSQGAESVRATLLHEAAHGLSDVRQIQDTSRQGRYHNTRYKALGEELGLVVT